MESKGPLILLVEDDADIRTIVELSLSLDPGITLVSAARGEEALKMIGDGLRPDLILLDGRLPGLSGIEICEMISAQPRLGRMPIVFLSALTSPGIMQDMLDAGAAGVISKPFDPLDLPSMVRDHAARAR